MMEDVTLCMHGEHINTDTFNWMTTTLRAPEPRITIHFKTISLTRFELTIRERMTVSKLKDEILFAQRKTYPKSASVVLFFRGSELNNDVELTSLRIQPDSFMVPVFK
jgi:hypothetical protein